MEKNANEKIPPSLYGLPARTELRQKSEKEITLCIRRKSRILMKDGYNIIGKAKKIRSKVPDVTIDVETTAPVCSKTRRLLFDNNIDIVTV